MRWSTFRPRRPWRRAARSVAAPGQTPEARPGPGVPPGSPFEEFFEEFFKNRRGGQGGPKGPNAERGPRRVNSLGSGFVIDATGLIVTNNHVISEADEITAVFNDGSKLKAEVLGRDSKTDLALLRVKPDKPLKAVKFANSDKVRLGEWVLAIGNPFSLGGSVTAGIVSARNRDINSGPYDNYIQTDASINRGNSGGPLFNLDGEVVGVNTAIISPSGGSIGIGFAVPANTAMAVLDQLREFKEVRRGWLGVKIQQVTDDIAESLNIKPVRGALVAGVDDKGPAKPAGIEPGDVIVKFDGKDIKEMRDLPKIVGDTPVGKDVPVIVVRKGKEETKTVRLGRLEDTPQQASVKTDQPAEEKSVVQKALGLNLAGMSDDLRKKFKIKDVGEGRGDHGGRREFGRRREAAQRRRRDRQGDGRGSHQSGRRAEAHRSAQEGRQEDRAAAGRECRGRRALRGADAAVTRHPARARSGEPRDRHCVAIGRCSASRPGSAAM